MEHKFQELQKKLKKELDSERYAHTLGVMYTAASLAMCHGADVGEAMTAGLLHDCAKGIPNEQKIEKCKQYHLDISEVEYANPGLLHAKLGAFLAVQQYQVESEDVIHAISAHTTGRPGMSLLEKIIYIADYMEPGRAELPNMKEVRKLAFHNIDECLYRILKDSLIYLASKKLPIDPMTQKTYEYYKEKLGKQEDS